MVNTNIHKWLQSIGRRGGTMRLVCLALVALCVVSSVSGMSTCKTLDLELVKKKRIEAIRGQILSKLRLPKEPEPEQAGEEEEIPAVLLSLYNSTEEMLKEQQSLPQPISTQQEEEEYFAKELHKFTMKPGEYRRAQCYNTLHIKPHA